MCYVYCGNESSALKYRALMIPSQLRSQRFKSRSELLDFRGFVE
jgi:hypothetical protein